MAFSAPLQAVQNGAVTNALVLTLAATTQNTVAILNIKIASNTITVSSVTDNAGNTYAKATGPHDSGTTNRMYQYYGVQTTGGATEITVSISGSIGVRAGAIEFPGGMTSNAEVFDKAATNTSTGTSCTIPIAPTSAGELIVAGVGCSGISNAVAGTNYTLGTQTSSFFDYYRLSGTTSETAPASWTTSSLWVAVAGAYIPAPPAPTSSSVTRGSRIQSLINIASLSRL